LKQSRVVVIAGLLLTGCETAPPKDSVRLCLDGACGQVPKATATFDPAAVVPDADPDGRLAALETMAAADPAAAFDLGMRLFRGDGFPRDGHAAMTWMRAAAEGGDTRAATALGRVYLTGLEEMGRDVREARTWLGVAAGRGDREAAALLKEAEALPLDEERWRARSPYWSERTLWWWRRSPYSYYWGPNRRWDRYAY
jgi:TPR repeat protein